MIPSPALPKRFKTNPPSLQMSLLPQRGRRRVAPQKGLGEEAFSEATGERAGLPEHDALVEPDNGEYPWKATEG